MLYSSIYMVIGIQKIAVHLVYGELVGYFHVKLIGDHTSFVYVYIILVLMYRRISKKIFYRIV